MFPGAARKATAFLQVICKNTVNAAKTGLRYGFTL